MAEGGMGAVYEVEQLSTGRKRALKTMHAALASNANSRERFTQEARIGSAIDSDHVVEVLAAGVDDSTGVPWLVMEMLDGETLGDRIERGPLSPSETLAVMDQMCHALAAAHRSGIVHRDLKPDNVFLAKARRGDVPFTVKILDFGIAKWVQELQGASANSQAMGTPMWMAPEQASPGVSIRPFTDVWALGLIAFAMLTGRSYWRSASTPGASVQSLVVEIMVEPLEPASGRCAALGCNVSLPRGFEAWFANCVVREPERRYPDAATALDALRTTLRSTELAPALPRLVPTAPLSTMSGQAVAAHPPVSSMPTPCAVSPPRPTGNRGLLIGMVVAGAMLLIGAVVFGLVLFWLGRRTAAPDASVGTPIASESSASTGGILRASLVTAGPLHACASLSDSSVRCWGNNMYGQLGDGSTQGHATPVMVPGLEGVRGLTAGSSYSCAVLEDGVVRCWGDNQQGQLGDQTNMSRHRPATVLDLTGAVAVSAGFSHTCAVINDHSVRCWGSDMFGGLSGAGLSGVKQVAVNVQESCAVLLNGKVSCWGAKQRKPKPVPGVTDALAVAVGSYSACVVLGSGGVRCWGKNDAGQLGNGSTNASANPVDVVGMRDAKDVGVGASHACALHRDGKVSCWGSNSSGQLGDGSGREQLVPVVVPNLVADQIAIGGNASYAIATDRGVRSWGANNNGQLGDGTTNGRAVPGTVSLGLNPP
jgi:serine/threonine-protein kinase